MTRSVSTASAHRATAWLLFWICLWMGTGVTLHHTDAAPASDAASPVHLHHPTAAVPIDLCAACEWSQGLQSGNVVFCPVPTPVFTLRPRSEISPRAAVRRAICHGSPRAPPALSA